MKRLWLCLFLCVVIGAASAAPPVTPESLAFLVVSDRSHPEIEARAESLIQRLRAFRIQGRAEGAPILQYHWDDSAERLYCKQSFHIQGAADLPYLAVVVLSEKRLPQRAIATRRAVEDVKLASAWAVRTLSEHYHWSSIANPEK